MSIRHSIKCTREEADKFLTDVKNYCLVNNIPFVKMISLTAYEGEVRIYNGNHDTRLSQKRVRQQDDKGYFLAKTHITKPEYIQVFRDEWYNPKFQEDEKQAIKYFFNIK